MKKMFLIAALAVFGMSQSDAQVKFGVKAGPQLTNLVGNDDVDASSKFGFHAGAYANIRFSDQLAFQPELLYSMQGAEQEDTYEEFGITYHNEDKIELSYINIPLMLKWYAYDGLNFEFGPQIGFNVAAKAKGDSTATTEDTTISTSYDEDIDDIETVDFGLNIGAGYEMPMGLNFGIRYGLGLTEIVKDSDMKNSVISLGIGYSF
ncbi:MAG TPA: porin family protein [Moheibacter sp.]|nr:porin family protein [Moheibacter sp.]